MHQDDDQEYAIHDLCQTITENLDFKFNLTVRQFLQLRNHIRTCDNCRGKIDKVLTKDKGRVITDPAQAN